MKHAVTGATTMLVVSLFGAWVNGFNFNERGESALSIYLITIVLTIVGGIYGAVIGASIKDFEENQ